MRRNGYRADGRQKWTCAIKKRRANLASWYRDHDKTLERHRANYYKHHAARRAKQAEYRERPEYRAMARRYRLRAAVKAREARVQTIEKELTHSKLP